MTFIKSCLSDLYSNFAPRNQQTFLSDMSKVIKLRKGLNINLVGKSEEAISTVGAVSTYALKPSDFPTLKPHMEVKEGAKVKAGSVLFTDKNQPEICFCSPVSGTVSEIRRAERRRITDVVITVEGNDYESFEVADWSKKSSEQLKALVLKSGLWPFIKQRPYDVVAFADSKPKAVYISTFYSAPLQANTQFTLKDEISNFQTGVDVLAKLSNATVYLGLDANAKGNIFANIKNVEQTLFDGPHPAGNVGVQINNTITVNKGETVWTVDPQAVVFIGKFFNTGKLDLGKIIALAGSRFEKPTYIKTIVGANVSSLISTNFKADNSRLISGDVLTGTKISADGYLCFYDNILTAIPEGNEYEFMGWAAPGFGKFSTSRSFFSWLNPKKQYDLNTNTHGEKRAYVVTGEFEKLFPMDIYPLQLIKACLAENLELMENLGIYEVAPEDFALCEFADTSKTDIQAIIRKALDFMIAETR